MCTLRPEAEQGRLHFVHSRGDTEPGTVLDFDSRDGHERIRLAALPYVHPNRYLHLFPGFGTTAGAYAAGLRELQEQLFTRLSDGYDAGRDVLLFTAHQYVAGAEPANSERMWEVREPYATAADALPQVAYCALGHIHKPQSVGIGRRLAGYAGSPLQMDFGESEETQERHRHRGEPRPAHAHHSAHAALRTAPGPLSGHPRGTRRRSGPVHRLLPQGAHPQRRADPPARGAGRRPGAGRRAGGR
ncbi:hypothetical protein ACRJ4W_35650 [Streptomyces sp. GLT-R25]